MSKYGAFRNRVKTSGETHLDGFRNSTKRQIRSYIQNSPSRSTVELLQLEEQPDKTYKLTTAETRMAIVSDKETFYKRTILFLPDEDVQLGSYVRYEDKVYLVTDISDVDGYPQAFVDYCNYELTIKGERTRIEVGKDNFDRPIYDFIEHNYPIPCVATSKIYSTLDNSPIPLPVGAILLYTPYHKNINLPMNYEFDVYGDIYQITTISKVNLLKDESGELYGYLEIRGQRMPDKE